FSAWNNLGTALRRLGDWNGAEQAFRRALEIQPRLAPGIENNLGNVADDRGDFDSAEAHYARAIELNPDAPEARWNLGRLLLRKGDYQRGWELYEWRLRTAGY